MSIAMKRRQIAEDAAPAQEPRIFKRSAERLLLQLGRSCGIATSYTNCGGEMERVAPVTLARLVNVLTDASLPDRSSSARLSRELERIIRERRREGAPPVLVAWNGRLKPTWIWLDKMPRRISAVLQGEGDSAGMIPLEIDRVVTIRRNGRIRLRIDWKRRKIPHGYYLLELQADDRDICCSLLVSAPQRALSAEKGWGMFMPTYALPPADSAGIGGFRELKAAAAFVRRRGGSFVSTLPLLSVAYEGRRADPSPYAPLSRLFWNEIFLDVPAPADGNGDSTVVDYERVYQQKKKFLQREAEQFFANGHDKGKEYAAFAAETPFLEEYAQFRAGEAPQEKRAAEERYHKYVQFLCHKELRDFRRHPEKYAELYLDYPVGVHQDGFDINHFGPLFMTGVQVGAPPDMFFSKGQNWGFQPLHPRKVAEDHFRYFRATLRNYFRYARMLRLDHIMGLYRLYCIPKGFSAEHGAYVHYPFEAMLAVLCLEAEKHGGVLAGEDLGTVPPAVRKAMTRHGISRMWVAQLEMKQTPKATFRTIKPNMIASLNTHDLFPFAAYMEGTDIEDLASLGVLSDKERESHLRKRARALRGWRGKKEALALALRQMAVSPARQVIINVEDLWRERRPQNIPGTWKEYANWRRKLSVPVAAWPRKKDVTTATEIMKKCGRSRGRR